MVVLPVFLQAPWVRQSPFTATLFTGVILCSGIALNLSSSRRVSELGALLVGFSGSWLAGCIFWGWLRAHPVLHLPVEAFALPLAIGGLDGRWKLASAFYLSSLLGTACTDLVMALTGVMRYWPGVVTAQFEDAPELLHQAGLHLLQPQPLFLLTAAAACLLQVGLILNKRDQVNPDPIRSMSSAVLITTLWVDGLFLLAALLQPGLSGLIE